MLCTKSALGGLSINELFLGQSASLAKTISESDVYLYAGVSGDNNPAHLNEQYASGTRFGRRIAHGMLSAGLISAALGTKLPGPGAIYLSQTLKFMAPVYFGDTVTATVTVRQLDSDKNRVILDTTCTNQNGTVVIAGEAVIVPQKGQ
ncbi:(R)-specific enoyl-CoA hydratase [bioreactor metagenome]|uniref:(R)-specific enoyl-CoA hydratase n=1 Tax=bioreactor metagenome TaxID=1076179 RepID=A0A644YN87_9ZZZZ